MSILSAVACRRVVCIVIVNGRLMPSEAAILMAIDGQTIVDPCEYWLPVTGLDKWRRKCPTRSERTGAKRPNLVGALRCHAGMKARVIRDLPERQHITDFREILEPTLLFKILEWRTSFGCIHWTTQATPTVVPNTSLLSRP